MNPRELWLKEYLSNKGIPSSVKTSPSGSVKWFMKFLKSKGITSGNVLDLGCGKGRNSLFFAKNGFSVSAIDFVPEIVNDLAGKTKGSNISCFCQSVAEKLPFASDSFDVIIDVYCYRYLLSESKQENYRKELFRVLKKNGHYLLSLANIDDSFFGSLVVEDTNIITDPVTGLKSVLYTEDMIRNSFKGFKIVLFENKKQKGSMHGTNYNRSALNFVMTKCLTRD